MEIRSCMLELLFYQITKQMWQSSNGRRQTRRTHGGDCGESSQCKFLMWYFQKGTQ